MSSLETASVATTSAPPLVTPDGRYIVVRGRLWRRSNSGLDDQQRKALTDELMSARRAVGAALRARDEVALAAARTRVHDAKVALSERGPVWWIDGTPDQNRRMAWNTVYADWYAALGSKA
ncbi:hypothetical protein [Sphingomonas jatrophae]|uniref:Uncharacterized protein n=1 Tax=Sphingomonas jatrophae TaxID=1166337 RepID=A0A1I6L7V2_9SPHN|nr:hypothetical protein [Sphingomonas jatrophae]SFR99583.1 hypothetical protein SAMN05192580_2422 [Sphingomonas jatrophae]